MADRSPIEWTDTTWQVVTGCSVVSPGCTNCYAMRLAGTRMKNHPSRAGLTIDTKAGPVWNGQVRFNADWLTQPLRWKRPRRIFVAAHGDLFHDGVTDDQLDQIFAVMALSPQHTFQVLTKRPERMRAYLTAEGWAQHVFDAAEDIPRVKGDQAVIAGIVVRLRKPLPNVWLGVSVEDQTRADERIPPLLATPAAVRWISAEPLLGPVTFRWAKWDSHRDDNGRLRRSVDHLDGLRMIDWVVAGGESGPGARPMHPDWARQLRDQCAAAGVPFLFKQWGDWAPGENAQNTIGKPVETADWFDDRWDFERLSAAAADSQTIEDEPTLYRAGKRAAGRLLDGQLHDAFPEARP